MERFRIRTKTIDARENERTGVNRWIPLKSRSRKYARRTSGLDVVTSAPYTARGLLCKSKNAPTHVQQYIHANAARRDALQIMVGGAIKKMYRRYRITTTFTNKVWLRKPL